MLTLITGGVKSGKSAKALELARKDFTGKKHFLATGVCLDEEMRVRIEKHRHDRGAEFETIEEQVRIDRFGRDNIILDCVTFWINNLMYRGMAGEWREILHGFLDTAGPNVIVVTNETGLGNIPMDPSVREYNRLLGEANREIAARADSVLFMVSGLVMKVK